MRSRSLRVSATILTIVCLTGIPAQAEPIAITQVIQVISNFNSTPGLQLRPIQEKAGTLVSDETPVVDQKSSGSKVDKTPESLISGITIKTDGPTTVEVIDQGDVEGTICDCGELFIAGGAFPKWPFFFLGAIPLFFIHSDCASCDSVVTPTPSPTPPSNPPSTPTPVPEPASLLLLVSGLAATGAALRRRRTKSVGDDKEEN
ncbi:MAG TPA: PEP-CTERM sorting domain-containing protein [Pyrinomonadaceae bacterium]|nr:PEP-CTERM sorting domain-containing protein [Pyrinomonadaceae bacterium]